MFLPTEGEANKAGDDTLQPKKENVDETPKDEKLNTPKNNNENDDVEELEAPEEKLREQAQNSTKDQKPPQAPEDDGISDRAEDDGISNHADDEGDGDNEEAAEIENAKTQQQQHSKNKDETDDEEEELYVAPAPEPQQPEKKQNDDEKHREEEARKEKRAAVPEAHHEKTHHHPESEESKLPVSHDNHQHPSKPHSEAPIAVKNQDSPQDDGIDPSPEEDEKPRHQQQSPKKQRSRSESLAVTTENDDDDEEDDDARSQKSGKKMSRKSSSFMEATRSSSAKRSNTPHPQDSPKNKRPAWKPSSKGKDLLNREKKPVDPSSPNFIKKNATNAADTTFGDLVSNLMGVDGRTTLPAIKQTYATNLFQQLHIAIHGRPPIGIKKKDGSRSAMFKKSAGLGGAAATPYSLVPPAAQNSANSFSIPPALLMPTVSTLNTSVTSNTARMRSVRGGTSVLSLLCITGNAETDTNPSASTCLRVVPSHADHRSIAVERVVPALPREGARFVGTFLGEDSTFLSRQFMTYDGVAAYEEDWQVLGDLVAGDFLASSLTQGMTRSGVVLMQSGPGSEPVTNAFCDGTQPFLRRMSEILIGACRHGKYAQQQNNNNNSNTVNAVSNGANNNDDADDDHEKHIDDDDDEDDIIKNPLQHSAVSNLAAVKRQRQKEDVKKRGSAAAAAAISAIPKFSKSVNNALALNQDPEGGAGVHHHQVALGGSIAEFTTIESLIDAYSFDFVAVSALDIAPGAQAHVDKANCDDGIYDLGTMQPVVLTQRKKHVPFKHSAIPIWTLPSDDIPDHHFRQAATVQVPLPQKRKGKKKRKTSKSSNHSSNSGGLEGESGSLLLSDDQAGDEDDDDDDNGDDVGDANASSPQKTQQQNLKKKSTSFINKGTVTSKHCKTADEISAAVAEFMQTKSPASGCHRLIFFTLRKDKPEEANKNNNKNKQQQSFHLTYEPTIIFCFLSSHMRRGKSQLDSTDGTKNPDFLRAIHRDHKEIYQCLEHVAKYDGMGKEQCMLQPYLFEGALTNILSTYAWLRADCCRTLCLSSVKAFSESPDETSNVLADADRVKRYPVHPRASTSFVSQGLPPIELPPLVAKQAEHILGKNIIASSSPKVILSPRSHPRQIAGPLSPSPPKHGKDVGGGGASGVSSPRVHGGKK